MLFGEFAVVSRELSMSVMAWARMVRSPRRIPSTNCLARKRAAARCGDRVTRRLGRFASGTNMHRALHRDPLTQELPPTRLPLQHLKDLLRRHRNHRAGPEDSGDPGLVEEIRSPAAE